MMTVPPSVKERDQGNEPGWIVVSPLEVVVSPPQATSVHERQASQMLSKLAAAILPIAYVPAFNTRFRRAARAMVIKQVLAAMFKHVKTNKQKLSQPSTS